MPKPINAANQCTFHAIWRGDLPIRVPNGQSFSNITLLDVLCTPDFAQTLVSIGLIDDAGYTVTFANGTCTIRDTAHKTIGLFPKWEGLYKVDTYLRDSTSTSSLDTSLSIEDAHRLLSHISPDAVKWLCKDGLITGFTLNHNTEIAACDSCAYAKLMHKPIPKERSGKCADSPGVEIHTDVWGPSPVKSLGGKLYYISFTDNKTCYTRVYLLALKSEAFKAYLSFKAWLKTQHGTKIKQLHSDRGGEYLSNEFDAHLATHGIERRLTIHDTPQENGVAERLNHTLLEKVHAMLHSAQLPKYL